jgi:hypothetical protein
VVHQDYGICFAWGRSLPLKNLRLKWVGETPRARICKRLRRPGIDSKESICSICSSGPPDYIAWRNRFLGIDSWALWCHTSETVTRPLSAFSLHFKLKMSVSPYGIKDKYRYRKLFDLLLNRMFEGPRIKFYKRGAMMVFSEPYGQFIHKLEGLTLRKSIERNQR